MTENTRINTAGYWAVFYVDGVNLNQELLKRGYAEVMYITPSEFNPYSWT